MRLSRFVGFRIQVHSQAGPGADTPGSPTLNMRILITAGPTREYLDDVRFLSNASSGKMGYALAEAAIAAGHQVVLVSGPVNVAPPAGCEFHAVETTSQM